MPSKNELELPIVKVRSYIDSFLFESKLKKFVVDKHKGVGGPSLYHNYEIDSGGVVVSLSTMGYLESIPGKYNVGFLRYNFIMVVGDARVRKSLITDKRRKEVVTLIDKVDTTEEVNLIIDDLHKKYYKEDKREFNKISNYISR